MADDDAPITTTDKPVDSPAPTPPDPNIERFSNLEQRLSAIGDVVTQALQTRQAQTIQGSGESGAVPQETRNYLRSRGLDDATIDANMSIIQPILDVHTQRVAGEFLGLIGGVQDEVQMMRAASDDENFPDWKTLAPTIKKLRSEAKKNNQYLSPQAAYQAAFVQDNEKVNKARAERAALSQSADATVSSSMPTQHGRRAGGTQAPVTADDLSKMTREQRQKFYEDNGNAVIR